MGQGYFVTGTDTGIGKTWSTVALIQYFKDQGKSVAGMKPVASGCEEVDGELRNADAQLLQQHSSISLPYKAINPYAFSLAVAPHIAAEKCGVVIEIDKIISYYKKIAKLADVVLVEGVGGWLVPLNEAQDIADLARQLNLPVIVIVGVRLGCINQAKLTFAAIRQAGVRCAGWIACCVEQDMQMLDENIQALTQAIDIPLLAVFPYKDKLDSEYFSQQLSDNFELMSEEFIMPKSATAE